MRIAWCLTRSGGASTFFQGRPGCPASVDWLTSHTCADLLHLPRPPALAQLLGLPGLLGFLPAPALICPSWALASFPGPLHQWDPNVIQRPGGPGPHTLSTPAPPLACHRCAGGGQWMTGDGTVYVRGSSTGLAALGNPG